MGGFKEKSCRQPRFNTWLCGPGGGVWGNSVAAVLMHQKRINFKQP